MEEIKKSAVGSKWYGGFQSKLALFTCALIIVPSYNDFWGNPYVAMLTAITLGIAIGAMICACMTRSSVSILLAIAFAFSAPAQDQIVNEVPFQQSLQQSMDRLQDANLGLEPPTAESPVAALVVVRCIFTGVVVYCVYRLIKFCDKKFPTETNAPPVIEFNLDGQRTDDEYGASFDYLSFEYCNLSKRDVQPEELAVTTTLIITPGDPPKIVARVDLRPEASQDWDSFKNEMEGHGLEVTRYGDGSQHFERNGFPALPEDVPIVFDLDTQTIVHGDGGRLITISRSPDLNGQWADLITIDTDDEPFAVVATTTHKQMFYRVEMVK